ncbi:MAG: hypothetical protein FJ286_01590 [Planctomycetes bacterium]|nr:hypothetical protein [Planctomycetota bacterium]
MTPPRPLELTPAQQAAAAKVACGASRAGTITLLCGPRGVGKSLVLEAVAAGLARGGRSTAIGRPTAGTDPAGDRSPRADVVLVDDAHLAAGPVLADLLDRCRCGSAVVLAGQGRLLTLVARDSRIEEAVALRAVIRPCTAAESAAIIRRTARSARFDDPATATIHEIAAAIPAAIRRLVELADVVAESRAGRQITAADVEAIHRRLSPLAA